MSPRGTAGTRTAGAGAVMAAATALSVAVVADGADGMDREARRIAEALGECAVMYDAGLDVCGLTRCSPGGVIWEEGGLAIDIGDGMVVMGIAIGEETEERTTGTEGWEED